MHKNGALQQEMRYKDLLFGGSGCNGQLNRYSMFSAVCDKWKSFQEKKKKHYCAANVLKITQTRHFLPTTTFLRAESFVTDNGAFKLIC